MTTVSGVAFADPVGLPASGTGPGTPLPPVPAVPVAHGFMVATFDLGPVSHVPGSGPLIKTITIPTTAVSPGDPIAIHLTEHLIVGPDTSWTDWHEIILTPGWHWASPVLTVGGAVIPLAPSSPTFLSWDFDPSLAPGTPIAIEKDLIWLGGVDSTGAPLPVPESVTILEYPTVPLPLGALMAAPVIALAGLRWRHQRVA